MGDNANWKTFDFSAVGARQTDIYVSIMIPQAIAGLQTIMKSLQNKSLLDARIVLTQTPGDTLERVLTCGKCIETRKVYDFLIAENPSLKSFLSVEGPRLYFHVIAAQKIANKSRRGETDTGEVDHETVD